MKKSLMTKGMNSFWEGGVWSSLFWLEHTMGGKQAGDKLGSTFSVRLPAQVTVEGLCISFLYALSRI